MICDLTDSAEGVPFVGGDVLILRGAGTLTAQFSPETSRAEAARLLERMAAVLRGTNGSVPPVPRLREDIADEPVKVRETDVPGRKGFSAFSEQGETSSSFAAARPTPNVDPETLTEDLVRWGDGCTAYKMNGRWWWVRWIDGERWGLCGPLLGAVAARKGPFDNFDETLASLARDRGERGFVDSRG